MLQFIKNSNKPGLTEELLDVKGLKINCFSQSYKLQLRSTEKDLY